MVRYLIRHKDKYPSFPAKQINPNNKVALGGEPKTSRPLYVAEDMSLEQLMAFTVTEDHARQEQVWESLSRAFNKDPHTIRRMLTEGAVKTSDRRAVFIGLDAYELADGSVLRDLFSSDTGGWLQDKALLDRLAREKLAKEADRIGAEGWKWGSASLFVLRKRR